jgi:anti-sigma regulatory factor (Ser/Thr protein kinase)
MSEGGLGLFLVKEFSEELRYEHSANTNIVSGFVKY